MKFKFCSDGDCPLWALAGLHAISSLPATLFKRVLDVIVEERSEDAVLEALSGTSLSSRDDCARVMAVVRWTLTSAWRSRCDGAQLTRDLLVLAVPRSHASAIADAAEAGRASYEASAKDNAFMVNRVIDASISAGPVGSVDAVTLTLHTDDVFTSEQRQNSVVINRTHIPTILEDLKKAYSKMEEMGVE